MNLAIAPAYADTNEYLYDNIHSVQPIKKTTIPIIQTFLSGSLSDDLIAIQPLPIEIAQDDDGTFVASDDIFLVYGSGDNQEKAFCDYIASLIEFYLICKKNAAGSDIDSKYFSKLQTFIQQKS